MACLLVFCRHHRRAIVEMLHDGCLELAFTAAALSDEPKNYHAWSHRWGRRVVELPPLLPPRLCRIGHACL